MVPLSSPKQIGQTLSFHMLKNGFLLKVNGVFLSYDLQLLPVGIGLRLFMNICVTPVFLNRYVFVQCQGFHTVGFKN